jgi:integrase
MENKTRLTDAVIRHLTPDPTGKPVIIWDRDLRGFGVLVGKTAKAYVVQRGTKIPRRTIEHCDLLSVASARDKAMEWLRMIGAGIDPKAVAVKPAATVANNLTVGQVAEKYLKRKHRRPATVRLYRSVFGLDDGKLYLGDWADLPIASITSDMVRQAHNAILARVVKGNRPGTDGRTMSDLAMRLFRSIWNFAASLDGSDTIADMSARNPVLTLGAGRDGDWHLPEGVRKRTRFIDDADLRPFWLALESAYKLNPVGVTCTRLMLLTGLRIGTATRLKWSMVDLANRRLDVPAELMKGKKPFSLPLVDGTYELLADWRKLGVATSGYVFPSVIAGRCITDVRGVQKHTGKPWSAHDLRRTFATNAKRAKVSKWFAADLLAHAASSVTDGYDMTDVEDLREPLQAITTRILALCNGTVTPMVKPVLVEKAA